MQDVLRAMEEAEKHTRLASHMSTNGAQQSRAANSTSSTFEHTVGSLTYRVEPPPKKESKFKQQRVAQRSAGTGNNSHSKATTSSPSSQHQSSTSSQATRQPQSQTMSNAVVLSKSPKVEAQVQQPDLPTVDDQSGDVAESKQEEVAHDVLFAQAMELLSAAKIMPLLALVKAHPVIGQFYFHIDGTFLKNSEAAASSPQQTLLQIFSRAGLFFVVKFLTQYTREALSNASKGATPHYGPQFVNIEARDVMFRTSLHLAAIGDLSFPSSDNTSARCNQVRPTYGVDNDWASGLPVLLAGIRLQDRQDSAEGRRKGECARQRRIHSLPSRRSQWTPQSSSIVAGACRAEEGAPSTNSHTNFWQWLPVTVFCCYFCRSWDGFFVRTVFCSPTLKILQLVWLLLRGITTLLR